MTQLSESNLISLHLDSPVLAVSHIDTDLLWVQHLQLAICSLLNFDRGEKATMKRKGMAWCVAVSCDVSLYLTDSPTHSLDCSNSAVVSV